MINGLGISEAADRLRQACFIERQLLHQCCGWYFLLPAYEHKIRLGYHAWDHAEHVDWLRTRLDLLRGGKPDANIAPPLAAAVEAALHAPDAWSWLRGVGSVVLPRLIALYRSTLELCCPAANAGDIRVLRRCLNEVSSQLAWFDQVLADDPEPDASRLWSRGLQHRFAAALDGAALADQPAITPFALPAAGLVFDERIGDRALMPAAARAELPHAEEVREQFRVFFNELYAAGMAAAVVFGSLQQDVPWTFVYDITRQFWDECRHGEFGMLRLREIGSEPDRCDQVLLRYCLAMPFLHQLAYLTQVLEPFYMPRKKPRFEQYSRNRDPRSAVFADHDWSDEINHVKFGNRWLQHLLADDHRSIDDLKEEVDAIVARESGGRMAGVSPF